MENRLLTADDEIFIVANLEDQYLNVKKCVLWVCAYLFA